MSLKHLQERISRIEEILHHYKSLRNEVIDSILEAYGKVECYTEDVEFTQDGVEIRYYQEDGWFEKEWGTLKVPYSVINTEDPIQAAREHHKKIQDARNQSEKDAHIARELRELARLQEKYQNLPIQTS
jgi:hypothetical protein